ncbi:HigA family addiction module antidote protein [Alcaligenaceae bacterium LF4-65]|uniref:HigA family addiction module antidote protein n=2 Tax=Zwartia hollandica TaxID=324606 RepID=A0A953N8U4_9BURK|nr:HigA family addiction module antidote protein [Zwartia hollandica]
MTRRLQEIHPGEILNEEFLKPLQITGRRLSSDIDVPASRISEILNGNRPITADTAVRLGIYFSMDPIFWINLQAEYDVRVAIRENKKTLQSRIRVYQPIAA